MEPWHSASPDSGMVHIAISLNLDKGGVVWLQPVTEEEYKASSTGTHAWKQNGTKYHVIYQNTGCQL